MQIRSERANDWPAIRALIARAFGQEQEADLVDALRTSGHLSISLVAEDASCLVGHAALSQLQSPKAALALAPVAVVPDRQRSGIGSALVRAALDEARRLGNHSVFVVGDPAYYSRFGFSPELGATFQSPYAGPYFMALMLTQALPTPAPVIYADAFNQLR